MPVLNLPRSAPAPFQRARIAPSTAPAPLASRVAPSGRFTPRGGGAAAAPVNPALIRARGRRSSSRAIAQLNARPLAGSGVTGAAQGKPRSLLGQLKDITLGVPQGLVGFGTDVLATGIAPIRGAIDLVKDQDLRGEGLAGIMEEYLPAITSTGESLLATGSRFIHPSRYLEAIEEGNIVGTAFEDIGNLALVAGGVGKALGTVGGVGAKVAAAEAGALGQAAPRSLSAATAATAEAAAPVGRIRTATAPLVDTGVAGSIENLTRVVPRTPTATIGTRARGLAGMAQKAGNVELGRTLERIGRPLTKAARMGEQYASPALPYQWAGKAIGKGFDVAGVTRPGVRIASAVARAGREGGFLFRFAEEGRRLAGIKAGVDRSATDAARFAVSAANLAKEHGLDESQGRAILLALDRPDLFSELRGIDDDKIISRVIDEAYPEVPTGQRVRVEDVRNLWALVDENKPGGTKLTPEVRDSMNAVVEAASNIALERTVVQLGEGLSPERRAQFDAAIAAGRGRHPKGWITKEAVDEAAVIAGRQPTKGGLHPEQLVAELRGSRIAAKQAEIGTRVGRIQRTYARKFPAAVRAQRLADATDAIADQIPEASRARDEFGRGRKVGREIERDRAVRDRYHRTQRELEAAVAEYERISENPNADLVKAEAELDRLIDQARQLRDMVDRAERRLDAASGLTRGVTVETPGGPVPQPGVSMPQGDAQRIKARAAELGEEQAAMLEAEIGRMTEGNIPSVPTAKSKGEGDWWRNKGGIGLTAKEKRRLLKEGWVQGRTRGSRKVRSIDPVTGKEKWVKVAGEAVPEGSMADNTYVADIISRQLGRTFNNVDEAMIAYVDAIRAYWDAKSGRGGASIIEQLALEMHISPERIAGALRGRIAEYGELLTDSAESAMGQLREEFQALTPDEQAQVSTTIDSILDEPDLSSSDIASVLDTWFPGIDWESPNGIMPLLDDVTDIRAVVDWMRGGTMPPSFTTKLATRTAAQNQQLGRLQGAVTGARQAVASNEAQQRAGVRGVERSLADAARTEATAAGGVEAAAAKATAAGDKLPGEGPRLSEVTEPSNIAGHVRTEGRVYDVDAHGNRTLIGTTNPMSPYERLRVQQGQRRAVANTKAAEMARLERARAKAVEDLGNVETELGRSYQDRLDEDLNRPAIAGWRNTVRKGGQKLGNIRGKLGDGRLDGLVARFATKHGIYDDLVAELDSMRQQLHDANKREEGGGFDLDAEDIDIALVGGPGKVPLPMLSPIDVAQAFDDVMARRGQRLEQTDQIAWDDSVGAESLLNEMAELLALEGEEGRRLNAPARIAELIHSTDWNMPDEIRSELRAKVDRYNQRRASTLAKVFDQYAEAIPARFRTSHMDARRKVGALLKIAEEENRVSPGSGDIYIQMAEDTASTLAEFVDKGIDPTHLTGGKEVKLGPGSGRRGLGQATLRAQRQRKHGLRPLSMEAYARVEASEALKHVTNRVNEYITRPREQGGFGQRVDAIPEVQQAMQEWGAAHGGEPMPIDDMARVAADAGWVPPEGSAVARDGMVIPKVIREQMTAQMGYNGPIMRGLRRGNQMWKSWVLPISPKWMTGNIIGNVIQAKVHAGIGPVELAKRMRDITKHEGGLLELWRRSGIPDWTPNEIANHGLTHGEYTMLRDYMEKEARTRIGGKVQKGLAASYKLNEFVDNMTRSAVYLSKIGDGVPTEAALRSTLNALGDFTRMSPVERRLVREILPFYSWLRHQTMATLRLPVHSPARAVGLLRLSEIYSNPDMDSDLLQMVGSRFPLGGNNFFDIGSVNPLADPFELPFSPSAIGRAITPLVKLPVAVTTGFDINRWDQVKRPAGTFNRGPFGQERATPPISRLVTDPLRGLGEIGYLAGSNAPAPIRGLRDLFLGDEARYATGYAVGDLKDPNKTWNRTLLRGLSLPAPTTIDVEGQPKRKLEQIARQRG